MENINTETVAPAAPVSEIVDPDSIDFTQPLSPRAMRRNHLVTLAQADILKFPDEKSFAAAMTEAFTDCGREVKQWSCCQELHQDGGIHYHYVASIGGKHCQRYEPVVELFKARHGVVIKFTKGCSGAYSRGYSYITKEGMGQVIHSLNHLTLERIREGGKRSSNCRNAFLQKATAEKKACL